MNDFSTLISTLIEYDSSKLTDVDSTCDIESDIDETTIATSEYEIVFSTGSGVRVIHGVKVSEAVKLWLAEKKRVAANESDAGCVADSENLLVPVAGEWMLYGATERFVPSVYLVGKYSPNGVAGGTRVAQAVLSGAALSGSAVALRSTATTGEYTTDVGVWMTCGTENAAYASLYAEMLQAWPLGKNFAISP
jgi:hypothetical protein